MSTDTSESDLALIKARWNEILDALLAENRAIWLAFFDARLSSLVDGVLTLSFADSEKFGGDHNFKEVRNERHAATLEQHILAITGVSVRIKEQG